ncbi:hypothetical protein Tco_1531779, partial [Tanacetum coccineum]
MVYEIKLMLALRSVKALLICKLLTWEGIVKLLGSFSLNGSLLIKSIEYLSFIVMVQASSSFLRIFVVALLSSLSQPVGE